MRSQEASLHPGRARRPLYTQEEQEASFNRDEQEASFNRDEQEGHLGCTHSRRDTWDVHSRRDPGSTPTAGGTQVVHLQQEGHPVVYTQQEGHPVVYTQQEGPRRQRTAGGTQEAKNSRRDTQRLITAGMTPRG